MAEQHLIGADKLHRAFKALAQDQVPFALSVGLTRVAQRAQGDSQRAVDTNIDRPTPFTQRAVTIKSATKFKLEARVFIRPRQAGYLKLLETGGISKPKKRALVAPVGVRLNKYGNMTRGRVRKLLSKPNVFSGKLFGIEGIWERRKGRRKKEAPKLLVEYKSQRSVAPQLGFKAAVVNSVKRNASERMVNAISFAMRTRKPR